MILEFFSGSEWSCQSWDPLWNEPFSVSASFLKDPLESPSGKSPQMTLSTRGFKKETL